MEIQKGDEAKSAMVRTQEKAVRRETLRITEQIKAENTLEWTGQL